MGIIVRCEDCGERFDSCNLLKVCSQCVIRRDEVFLEVRERMQQNPDIKIRMACEELGLSERVTSYIVKKDREESDMMRDKSMRLMLKENLRR